MAKKHIKSADKNRIAPMKARVEESFNGVAGATLENVLQIAAGVKVTGLNPHAARELEQTITRRQLSELKQHPQYNTLKNDPKLSS